MNKLCLSILALFLTFYLLTCTSDPATEISQSEYTLPDLIDFNFHVKPILSDKCFKCHGPDVNTRKAGLALHEENFAFAPLNKDSTRFAIVKGDTSKSVLLKVIKSADPNELMPPPTSKLSLTSYEINVLKKWIDQGAQWKQHWSFTPPKQKPIPKDQSQWSINNIDRYVLSKLNQSGLEPSPKTEKAKLLRRLSFTLTGLPPSISELEDFLNDESAYAYEKVVDRLLASTAYAERMTQIWMDLARYADSHGYQDDPERFMWPWRDWVIHAYNTNMPYDQFVRWQLAGDMIDNARLDQIIASGFNRNHKITYEGGSIPEEFRTEYVADRTQTFGIAFLGLTVECSRCHDHKYDPISQQNYFELFAFFNNIKEEGFVEPVGKTPDPFITLTKKEINEQIDFINALDTIEKVELMVMKEMDKPRPTFILNRGQYDKPTKEVFPATPVSILPLGSYPKNRLGLANWLFDPQNPLTARVAVNRLWQQVFGSGIVATSFDFGNQGSLPSHPELLDYLALQYQTENWDTKAMLKRMVMSATFKQSSKITPNLLQKDPENKLLGRYSRLRLGSEMIRDQVLKSSRLLSSKIGGPSVKPYQPAGLWEETIGGGGDLRNYVQDEGENLYRRSLYTFWKRTVPPPSMITFDASTKDLCTVKRQETNTPLQALVLMNDPQIIEASRLLAHAALEKENIEHRERIVFMFHSMASRPPTDEEIVILEKYYKEELKLGNKDQAKAYTSIGTYKLKSKIPVQELAAYTKVANLIINLDEVINRG